MRNGGTIVVQIDLPAVDTLRVKQLKHKVHKKPHMTGEAHNYLLSKTIVDGWMIDRQTSSYHMSCFTMSILKNDIFRGQALNVKKYVVGTNYIMKHCSEYSCFQVK